MRKLQRPTCPNPSALKTDYKHPENKKVLIGASFGKCVYCESIVTHVYYGDVEHIRPKSKYPQLEFDWSNLGFVCAKCNGAKSDKFNEDTPYINPYEEDPEEHLLAFGAQLMQKGGSERGELTIKDICLNRLALVEKRQTRIEDIEKAINACMRTANTSLKNTALKALKSEADIDKEYSLFIKTLLHLHGVFDL